jgi:hypothetical protein
VAILDIMLPESESDDTVHATTLWRSLESKMPTARVYQISGNLDKPEVREKERESRRRTIPKDGDWVTALIREVLGDLYAQNIRAIQGRLAGHLPSDPDSLRAAGIHRSLNQFIAEAEREVAFSYPYLAEGTKIVVDDLFEVRAAETGYVAHRR